jgi:PAS domain S-box-containing protein
MSVGARGGGLKLSGKMALFFLALVLSQAFITLAILTTIIARTNLDSVKSRMSDTVQSAEGYLGETLNDLRLKGALIAGQQKTVDYTDYGLKNLLARELVLFKESLGIESLAVYAGSDSPFAATGPSSAEDPLFRDKLAEASTGSNALFVSQGAGAARLLVLSPIKRGNRIIGVLSLGLLMDEGFVRRVEKIINAHVLLRFGSISVHGATLPAGIVDQVTAAGSPPGGSRIMTAGQYVVGTLDLHDLGLAGGTVSCLMDTTESTRQIRRYNVISLAATFLILTLALVSGVAFYQRTFLHKFQAILRGITNISHGDFNPPFRLPWRDEFGQLTQAFDDMCRKLLVREKELSQLSRYNTLVLDNVRSGILSVNLQGELTAINRAAEEILCRGSKMEHRQAFDSGSLPPGLVPLVRGSLHEEAYATGREVAVPGRDGPGILSVSSSPLLSPDGERIGVIVICEDITKEKSLEERLALSTKLAALGEMAAGVAHQVRNPLVVMKVSSEMLRDNFSVRRNAEKYRKLTRLMVDEIDALNLVVSNFLDFARPRKVNRAPCTVRSVVDFALESLPLDRFPGITVRTLLPEKAAEFPMDRNLVTQVLSNLILNALQASCPGKSVEVRARFEDGGLCIEVEDWGAGMDEETRRRIFNPFFTTRDTGTGLGLSIAHRIIESHDGSIDVRSRPGEGSTFVVRFPAYGEPRGSP